MVVWGQCINLSYICYANDVRWRNGAQLFIPPLNLPETTTGFTFITGILCLSALIWPLFEAILTFLYGKRQEMSDSAACPGRQPLGCGRRDRYVLSDTYCRLLCPDCMLAILCICPGVLPSRSPCAPLCTAPQHSLTTPETCQPSCLLTHMLPYHHEAPLIPLPDDLRPPD